MGAEVVADAARRAPHATGVYLFVDARERVVYVGKAIDLARRLASHARPGGHRVRGGLTTVTRVVWDLVADDDEALGRELDLIAVLEPSKNKALRTHDRFRTGRSVDRRAAPPWPYLTVEPTGDAWRLRVTYDASVAGHDAKVHGCVPHLRTGVASPFVNELVAGHSALLRLLWAVTHDAMTVPFPGRITRQAVCADHVTPVEEPDVRPLHDFLGGTSPRLLERVAAVVSSDAVAPMLRPALRRDLAAAARFFELGPARVRRIRRRHGPARGSIAPLALADLLRAEIEVLLEDQRPR